MVQQNHLHHLYTTFRAKNKNLKLNSRQHAHAKEIDVIEENDDRFNGLYVRLNVGSQRLLHLSGRENCMSRACKWTGIASDEVRVFIFRYAYEKP